MRFLVIGPGAMGCLFAVRLKKAGYNVTLLDYNKERAESINDYGIRVEGLSGEYTEKVPTIIEDPSEPPDFVLICVKSYHTLEAAQAVKQWRVPETVIVTLQNGVGNVEILSEILGKENVLGGVTAEGATLLEPGRIRHAGQGETVIGPKGVSDGPAERIVSALNQAGFQSRSVDNVDDLIWGKLIINVGINALTAITRLKNGRLPEFDGTRRVMEQAVKEAVAVANARNIELPYPDPLGRVMDVCRATAGNISSMLQDVLKERVTEVDFINGAIVREGNRLGIPTPVNLSLTLLVQAIQETYKESIR